MLCSSFCVFCYCSMSNILDRGYNIEIKVKEKQCYRKLLCAAYNVYIALARYVKRNITMLNRLKSVVFERIVEVDKRFRFSMQPEEVRYVLLFVRIINIEKKTKPKVVLLT